MILVNGIEIEQNHFPDGTLSLKYELNSLSKNIAPIIMPKDSTTPCVIPYCIY